MVFSDRWCHRSFCWYGLQEYEQHGIFRGCCSVGFRWQDMENTHLREHLQVLLRQYCHPRLLHRQSDVHRQITALLSDQLPICRACFRLGSCVLRFMLMLLIELSYKVALHAHHCRSQFGPGKASNRFASPRAVPVLTQLQHSACSSACTMF